MGERTILIVEDDPDINALLAKIMARAGHEPTRAYSGTEALLHLERGSFDLMLLDLMLPGASGGELIAHLRGERGLDLPVIVVSAKAGLADKVDALALGADDYVAKPFLPQELVLRIAAVLRRCYAQESPLLELDASVVDFDTAEVRRADGQTAVLTAKEHEILSVLARNLGRIVTIDSLCEACWGTSFGYENSLMAHIRRLREKIEANPSKPASLVTARGLGYKLVKRG